MKISAIILAAGQSKRMGRPKMSLPWENTTVLGRVIATIQHAGVDDVLVVSGAAQNEVEEIAARHAARVVHNPNFEHGEMLTSIQLGLGNQNAKSKAALICLGDQPQVEEACVRSICDAFRDGPASLIVPSYDLHRGHPWLIAAELWNEVQRMRPPESMRDFLNKHAADIFYVEMKSQSILQDVDTLEDYSKYKPQL
jgi:molybdenum cofactor cytidylyltransferase